MHRGNTRPPLPGAIARGKGGRQDKRTRHRAASKVSLHVRRTRHRAVSPPCRMVRKARTNTGVSVCFVRPETPELPDNPVMTQRLGQRGSASTGISSCSLADATRWSMTAWVSRWCRGDPRSNSGWDSRSPQRYTAVVCRGRLDGSVGQPLVETACIQASEYTFCHFRSSAEGEDHSCRPSDENRIDKKLECVRLESLDETFRNHRTDEQCDADGKSTCDDGLRKYA